MGTERVSFNAMRTCYEGYRADTAPCKSPAISNQCAVRMSVALVNNGFSLENFPQQRRIHQGRASCQIETPHLVGANELHLYLLRVWDTGLRGSGSEIKSQIADAKGIIYFNNCFHRRTDGEGANSGDHIDLWNGANYYNQILGIGAGGNARAGTDLFSRASFVRFFWLPE